MINWKTMIAEICAMVLGTAAGLTLVDAPVPIILGSAIAIPIIFEAIKYWRT